MSELLITEEFVNVLNRLNILLTNLPSQLPLANDYYDSQYPSFLSFSLDPDILKKTGDEIAILELGKAICALHGILKLYYKKYPTNNVLKKWVDDITARAEKVYEMYDVPILEFSKEPGRQQGTKRPSPDVESVTLRWRMLDADQTQGTEVMEWDNNIELWQQAIQESGDNSLGARLQKDLPAENIPMEVSIDEPPMKRLRAHNTLNIANLQEMGKRIKEDAHQLFQDKVDHVIMCLICVCGLVPHVIESTEWKELMGLLSDSYCPTSATTFADKHIPQAIYTVRSVGEGNWGATCSDSTDVMKAGCCELVTIVGTMLDLCDAMHHLHNTIRDINKLLKLKFERNIVGDDEPVKALKKIGKTHFGTHWTAANALDPCLPHIHNLVAAKTMKKNTKIQGMFMNQASGKYSKFKQSLLQYITIVAPIIQPLWSLEAAHANASNIFIFWLAIIAMLNDLFSKGLNVTGIPVTPAHEVMAIINKQYHEFFTNEVYFVAFALDPWYPNSNFFKKTTANTPTIVIPVLSQRTGQHTPLAYPHAYTHIKDFLKDKLQKDLAHYVMNPKSAPATSIFKHQIKAFWHDKWPFNQQVKDDNPLAWWESLQDHLHAHVLAHLTIKIFSVLVNSMPNEYSDNEDEADDKPLESRQPAQDVAFKIHPDININSKALKDMVSTDPVSTVSIDLLLDSVLSPWAATMTDNRDADWNY
ncbi:hypothetical protein BDR05DRAFT_947067 [Suillus weaverae]|nr:hypothetical protein BDR05DRAFT_947067 [Suillus weaverae]